MDLQAYLYTYQGSLVVVLALFMPTALACEGLTLAIMKVVARRVWWPTAMPLQKGLMMNYGYTEDQCTPENCLESFAFVLVICGHHFLMGLLTTPVVAMGWSGAGPTWQLLFMLALLGDVTYSLYDWIKKFCLTFFHAHCKCLGPPCPKPFFIILCVLHHTLSMVMVVPMNVKYSFLPAYHRIACALLLAAGICFLTGQYKFTLDVQNKGHYMQFKVIVVVQFVTLWYTRGFVWLSQIYSALTFFHAQGDTHFFIAGCVASALMTLFNVVMLMDCTTAALKWLPKGFPEDEEEFQDLQADILRQCSTTLSLGARRASQKEMHSTLMVAMAAVKFKKPLLRDIREREF
mmetsp:Transcript_64547/g.179574  ORF Transcript_64547/g.179574 Transcript_64547/m.179574 type:complete len:347 (+) Transcript_64547:121-1161(+)